MIMLVAVACGSSDRDPSPMAPRLNCVTHASAVPDGDRWSVTIQATLQETFRNPDGTRESRLLCGVVICSDVSAETADEAIKICRELKS